MPGPQVGLEQQRLLFPVRQLQFAEGTFRHQG
jgi:hypothetical protein